MKYLTAALLLLAMPAAAQTYCTTVPLKGFWQSNTFCSDGSQYTHYHRLDGSTDTVQVTPPASAPTPPKSAYADQRVQQQAPPGKCTQPEEQWMRDPATGHYACPSSKP